MSRQRTLSRLHVLEAQHPARQHAAIVRELAQRLNLDEAEIMEEAEHLARKFHEAGLVTFEQQLAHVARDMGITVEELQAEIDELLAACP